MKVDVVIRAYEDLIRELISNPLNRRRFVEIEALAVQANALLRVSAESNVSDVNAIETIPEACSTQFAGPMGETGEVLRTLMTTFQPMIRDQQQRTRADAGRASAEALIELVKARTALLNSSLSTREVDAQIEQLRKELGDVVVSSLILRGHSTGANDAGDDAGVLDEGNGSGTDGAGGSSSHSP